MSLYKICDIYLNRIKNLSVTDIIIFTKSSIFKCNKEIISE